MFKRKTLLCASCMHIRKSKNEKCSLMPLIYPCTNHTLTIRFKFVLFSYKRRIEMEANRLNNSRFLQLTKICIIKHLCSRKENIFEKNSPDQFQRLKLFWSILNLKKFLCPRVFRLSRYDQEMSNPEKKNASLIHL